MHWIVFGGGKGALRNRLSRCAGFLVSSYALVFSSLLYYITHSAIQLLGCSSTQDHVVVLTCQPAQPTWQSGARTHL
jgi:hypothetical protein